MVPRSPAGDAIRVKGLRKSFGDWPVLWDLDLTVGWGELLVLFGANGAGKTTLLRVIATQARPDAVTVTVAGYDWRRQPEAVLSRLDLAGHADHRVRTLSHGMRQRLAIARAILHQPPLLLLDEPEAGLDQGSLAMLKDLLQEWSDEGRTVVMTTHNLELGLAWAQRVAVLAEGRLHHPTAPDRRDLVGLPGMVATPREGTR